MRGNGGGLFNSGTATIVETTIDGSQNGGIHNTGHLTIDRSTLSNNTSDYGGAISNHNTLVMTNSTLSGNSGHYGGGGIYTDAGTATIEHSTIAYNSGYGGAGIVQYGGTVNIGHTLFGGNRLGDDYMRYSGTLNSLGYNVVEIPAATFNGIGDQVNVDAMVLPLADNGGPTLTHSFEIDSPAANGGNSSLTGGLDQRNMPRVHAGTIDVGALENENVPTVFTVNSTVDRPDANPGDGVAEDIFGNTTLRAAIMESNALAGHNTVVVPAGTYYLTRSGTSEDAAATGDLDLTDDITIIGASSYSTVIDSTVSDRLFHNHYGTTAVINGVALRDGSGNWSGGNLFNAGTLSMEDVYISNGAASYGGNIYNTGTLVLDEVDVAYNGGSRPVYYGGNIYNTGSVTINRGTIAYGQANYSGGNIYNRGTMDVTRAQVRSGVVANGIGGNVYNGYNATITVDRSPISGGEASRGGGLYNDGTATVIATHVSSNDATWNGGGIYNRSTLTLDRSLVSHGSANSRGGGLFQASGSATVVNSTFSTNEAANGGGIYVANGSAKITHSTIAANISTYGTGISQYGGAVILTNTIVDRPAFTAGAYWHQSGYFFSAYSLIRSINKPHLVGSTNLLNVSAQLQALAVNGGPTFSHMPLVTSPVINAGSASNPPATDQRGEARVFGNGIDIGAIENEFVPVTFVVDSTEDWSDNIPGDGLARDVFGHTTLRAAIMEANALPGHNTIVIPAGTYSLSDRFTDGTGFDLDITDDLTIIGAGATSTVIETSVYDRIFQIHSGVTVDISSLTVQNGMADYNGGNILNAGTLTLTSAKVLNGSAYGNGGGLFNSGTATIVETTIDGNDGNYGGGGIHNTGHLTIERSTLSRNSGHYGGGISTHNTLVMTNSTVSGNSGYYGGGGIFIDAGTATIKHSTIAYNNGYEGVGMMQYGGTVNIGHTLFGRNNWGDGDYTNYYGTLNSLGYNVISYAATSFYGVGDQMNVNPMIQPLANNGGPTQTHSLASNSPAINAGLNSGAPNVDQTGAARIYGGIIDVGAFEYRGTASGSSSYSAAVQQSSASAGQNSTASLVRTNGGQPVNSEAGDDPVFVVSTLDAVQSHADENPSGTRDETTEKNKTSSTGTFVPTGTGASSKSTANVKVSTDSVMATAGSSVSTMDGNTGESEERTKADAPVINARTTKSDTVVDEAIDESSTTDGMSSESAQIQPLSPSFKVAVGRNAASEEESRSDSDEQHHADAQSHQVVPGDGEENAEDFDAVMMELSEPWSQLA